MLRIGVASQSTAAVLLKLEGWVSGDGVGLLQTEGRRWLGQGRGLVLDLEGVHFIDPLGLDLLEGWSGARLELRGGSMFVRTLLQNRGLVQGPDPSPP
jgi:anti-anti-sigma regulatory factor